MPNRGFPVRIWYSFFLKSIIDETSTFPDLQILTVLWIWVRELVLDILSIAHLRGSVKASYIRYPVTAIPSLLFICALFSLALFTRWQFHIPPSTHYAITGHHLVLTRLLWPLCVCLLHHFIHHPSSSSILHLAPFIDSLSLTTVTTFTSFLSSGCVSCGTAMWHVSDQTPIRYHFLRAAALLVPH